MAEFRDTAPLNELVYCFRGALSGKVKVKIIGHYTRTCQSVLIVLKIIKSIFMIIFLTTTTNFIEIKYITTYITFPPTNGLRINGGGGAKKIFTNARFLYR